MDNCTTGDSCAATRSLVGAAERSDTLHSNEGFLSNLVIFKKKNSLCSEEYLRTIPEIIPVFINKHLYTPHMHDNSGVPAAECWILVENTEEEKQ